MKQYKQWHLYLPIKNATLGNLTTTGKITTNGGMTIVGPVLTYDITQDTNFLRIKNKNSDSQLSIGPSGDIYTSYVYANNANFGGLTTGAISTTDLAVGGTQWKPSPHQIQSLKQKAANKCLSASGDLKLTVNETCNSNDINQFWYWMGDNLVNAGKNLCVEMPSDRVATKMKLAKCDPNATGQVLYKQKGGFGMNGIGSVNYGGQLFFNPADPIAQIEDGWSCGSNNNTSPNDRHGFCYLYYGKPF